MTCSSFCFAVADIFAYPYPGRSTRYHSLLMRKWFTSLVLPGLLEVIASFLLRQSMLIRDDFPTFDLPMNANSGNFCFGFSETLVLLPEKRASVIFIKNYLPY